MRALPHYHNNRSQTFCMVDITEHAYLFLLGASGDRLGNMMFRQTLLVRQTDKGRTGGSSRMIFVNPYVCPITTIHSNNEPENIQLQAT